MSSRKTGVVGFRGCFNASVWRSRLATSFRYSVASFLCPRLALTHSKPTQSLGSLFPSSLLLKPSLFWSQRLRQGVGRKLGTMDLYLDGSGVDILRAIAPAVNSVDKGSMGREQDLWSKGFSWNPDPATHSHGPLPSPHLSLSFLMNSEIIQPPPEL